MKEGSCWKIRRTTAVLAATLALAAMALPRSASALTTDGAMMTNSAWATFSGVAGVGVWYRTSYLASSSVVVCNPIVAYVKTATPTMVMPTGTVTFTLCMVNSSITTSAFNMVITDKLPDNMGYLGASWTAVLTPPGGAWTATFATTMGGAWCVPNCQPPAGSVNTTVAPGAYYLRWVITVTGPGKSACVSYGATVL
jgi:uncharacterized repeat protein (TIGR01451 family)